MDVSVSVACNAAKLIGGVTCLLAKRGAMVQVIRDILTSFSSFPEDGDSSLSEVLLPGCTVGSVRYHSEFRSAPL